VLWGHGLCGGARDVRRRAAGCSPSWGRLFAELGVDAVSLDAVAAEAGVGKAGVGKGAVFRRFGDKSGLAAALLDERERALQRAMALRHWGRAPRQPHGRPCGSSDPGPENLRPRTGG